MKNELVEAKDCLERACPLMELLPASLLENAGVGNPVVDFGLKGEGLSDEHFRTNNHHGAEDGKAGNNYASDCFALLRNVYLKLYGAKKGEASENDVTDNAASSGIDDHQPPDHELSFDQDYDFEYDDPSDPDYDSDDSNTSGGGNSPFNIETKIEELRMPFQHLRSELIMIHGKSFDSDNYDYEYYEFSPEESERGELPPPTANNQKARKSAFNANSNSNNNFNNKGSSESKQNNPASRMNGVPGFRGNFFMGSMHGNGIDSYHDENGEFKDPLLMGLGGSATSIIASDLEVMLRKFVKEDLDGQLDLYNVARKYYDELDVNFPQVRITHLFHMFFIFT